VIGELPKYTMNPVIERLLCSDAQVESTYIVISMSQDIHGIACTSTSSCASGYDFLKR